MGVSVSEGARIMKEYGQYFVCEKEKGSVWYFDVFDGNHRVSAMQLIAKTDGEDSKFPKHFLVQCNVYLENCPSKDCIVYAKRINDIQLLQQGTTYVPLVRS